MGTWLKLNGESLYGTRAGLIPPAPGVVSTHKPGTHYLHLLEYTSDCVTLQGVPGSVTSARLLRDGSPLKLERYEDRLVLLIPPELRDPFDTVVVLK
jgi:alpha-L-fucosidase